MDNELKPCPFCGGESHVYKVGLNKPQWYAAGCRDCYAETGEDQETEQAAIKAWNTRNQWVSVKEQKPKEEKLFLLFSPVYGYQCSMYANKIGNSSGLPTLDRLKITHWMPLPLPPEEDK